MGIIRPLTTVPRILQSRMSSLEQCVANFAICAWTNRLEALPTFRRGVEDYLAGSDDLESQIFALCRLRDQCAALKLDSTVALTLEAEINQRIQSMLQRSDVFSIAIEGDAHP